MHVTIIGTGYVGLTTGVCLAYLGHEVACLDIDAGKVEQLRAGVIPIYEPWLRELMELAGPRLRFTRDYADCVPSSDAVFIAVGTPSQADGNPDLRYLRAAAQEIGRHLSGEFTVVVNKSTVPVGSGNWVEALIRTSLRERDGQRDDGEHRRRFAVASNPEFLREGTAIKDSLYPDRIVVGVGCAAGFGGVVHAVPAGARPGICGSGVSAAAGGSGGGSAGVDGPGVGGVDQVRGECVSGVEDQLHQ